MGNPELDPSYEGSRPGFGALADMRNGMGVLLEACFRPKSPKFSYWEPYRGSPGVALMISTTCRQCGKEFKPQALHSHMQSCRGFRERMRNSASTRVGVDRSQRNSTARRADDHSSSPERPTTAFLLTES